MSDVEFIAPTKRRSMTKARAAKIFLARNGVCFVCGNQIRGDAWIIEHPDPVALGGSDNDADLWPAHERCRRVKDKTDVRDIAKRNRLVTKGYAGKRKPQSRFKRKVNGQTVWRDSGEPVR